MTSLVLASASPARLGLLRASGIDPDVVVSDVDEDAVETEVRRRDPDLSPAGLAQVLAEAKGATVRDRLAGDRRLVLACDSVLEIDGAVHGKPGTVEVARRRWRDVRGRTGVLHTGHWLVDPVSGRNTGATASATVHFADITDEELEGYLATGEPLHVAGGFTLDGVGAPFVESIEGHPSTVVGLCLPLLRRLLGDLDIPWWDVASA
ncbi:Maf family nucleotide pyrophosphatase [Janibacter cremeus]|uniref:Maf family protein n=1 Tax=Janibacter cremeus TaxID=1285192 RepID=UPI0023F969C8|nr:Maf family nucleotide pyrophosphatase [Janibacter cremeus]WEV79679.1 Maf family nucleotide pyrophosphatase [Janibacter cremeus]